MAISKSNVLLHSLRGMVGKELVFRVVNGKTIVSVRPDFSKVKWSEKQKAHRKKFRNAARKAKELAMNPGIRKNHEKKLKPGMTVYNVILKELMRKS
jgi:hypothetical protein